MTSFELIIYTMKFMIPSVFTVLFRAFGLGYRSRSRMILGFMVLGLYLTIVPSVLIVLIGYGEYTHIVSLVMTVGAMAMFIFSSDPPGKTLLLLLIVAQMNIVVSVPLNMIRHLLGLSYLVLDFLLLLACLVVYFAGLRFWAKPLRFIADNLHGRLVAPMLIPLVTTAMVYAIPVYPAENFSNHPIYCTMLILAVELAFFLYIYTLYRSLREINILSQQKLDAELLRLSATSMAERLRLMDEAAYQSSLAAHDRRHFNSMILELLEQGHFEEATTFLRKQSEAKTLKDKHYCANTAINAIVSYYVAQAENAGIITDIQMEISNTLTVDSLELAMALSNLLENAIHGCEALPKDVEKHIYLVCRQVGRLALEIANPCLASTVLDENGYPSAQRQDHGIGTKSVVAFVAKYDAELFYRVENGVFTVRLLI